MKPSKSTMGSVIPLAFVLLVSVASPRALVADDEWVEVTGEAAIVGDNLAHAREIAQAQALRSAVEMVAGTVVSGISESRQFISVRDEITSQGAGYVRRYEVLGSECEEGTCKVRVRALVAKRALTERLSDLGLLIQRRGYPRVIMMVQEQNVGDERPRGWWFTAESRSMVVENTLVAYLNRVLDQENEACTDRRRNEECWKAVPSAMRFTFVDYRSVSSSPLVQEAKAGVDLTDEQARELARLMDAELAIVGRAIAVDQGSPWGVESLRSIKADLSLRLLDVRSAEVLGSVSSSRVQSFTNAALGGENLMERVAREAVPEIQKAVAEAWSAEASGDRSIRLEITGLASFNDLNEFRTLLSSSVTGVRAVTTRSMSGTRASLDLRATLTADQLAAELSMRPVGRFNPRVVKMDSAMVEIDLGG